MAVRVDDCMLGTGAIWTVIGRSGLANCQTGRDGPTSVVVFDQVRHGGAGHGRHEDDPMTNQGGTEDTTSMR